MRPCFTGHNVGDVSLMNVEPSRNLCLANLFFGKASNGAYIIFSQFATPHVFTTAKDLLSLSEHVFHVLFRSAQEKVVRIYTESIVTVMAYIKSSRHFAFIVCQQPRKTMHGNAAFRFSNEQVSISSPSRSLPNPASVCFNYFLPKSLLGSCWFPSNLTTGFNRFVIHVLPFLIMSETSQPQTKEK